MPAPRRSATAIALALLALIVSVTPAAAQHGSAPRDAAPADPEPDWLRKQDRKPQVELFLSSLFANSATEGSFGLRGSWHLKRRFSLEGSLSRIDAGSLDIFLIDFSAKYFLRDRGRTDVYLVGGPGGIFEGAFEDTESLLHLGVGLEVDLSRRLYFRPEIRGRWFAEDLGAVNIGDLSLGFGWRL